MSVAAVTLLAVLVLLLGSHEGATAAAAVSGGVSKIMSGTVLRGVSERVSERVSGKSSSFWQLGVPSIFRKKEKKITASVMQSITTTPTPLKPLSSVKDVRSVSADVGTVPVSVSEEAKSAEGVKGSEVAEVPEKVDCVVVGGGLCGSTAAFYLDKKGFNVVLAEQAAEVGGCVNTKQKDGFLWEEGANSFQPNTKLLQLAKDMGLIDELVLANASLPRFIFWNGKLNKLPTSVREFRHTKLLSSRGKIRLLAGLMGAVGPCRAEGDESIEEFATRHFGKEVYARMVDPFVSGVYAGDPHQLSVQSTLGKVSALEAPGITRSVVEGALVNSYQSKLSSEVTPVPLVDVDLPQVPSGSLGSFKRGLQSLPLQVAAILGKKCQVSHSLEKVIPSNGGWLSTFKLGTSGKSKTYFSRSILLTMPAFTTAKLLGSQLSDSREKGVDNMPLAPAAAQSMQEIYYPPVVGVYLAYPNDAFKNDLQGFGHLIPRANKIRSLGSIWCSTLFPGRAPEGYSMLLTFIGGAQDPKILDLSTEEIVKQVDKDLRRIVLKPGAPPPRVISVKTWRQGIPQYNRGYENVRDEIRRGSSANPGLFIGGNFISGVSVGDCINYGAVMANNISSYILKSRFS